MKDENSKNWYQKMGVSLKDVMNIAEAVSQVYPMIVLANLTKNTYTMLRNEGLLYNEVQNSGVYENLIDDNVSNIHPNYQHLFLECFSREHLLKSYSAGNTEVYAELYQKDKQGQYQWVSIHTIRIETESGDICHVCLNRSLHGIVTEKHSTPN